MRTVQKGDYRQDGNHLFKKVGSAYVHVYQDAFCKNIGELIESYEDRCEKDLISGNSDAYSV